MYSGCNSLLCLLDYVLFLSALKKNKYVSLMRKYCSIKSALTFVRRLRYFLYVFPFIYFITSWNISYFYGPSQKMPWNLPKPSGKYPVACTDIVTKAGLDGTLFRLYYPTKNFEPCDEVSPMWLHAPEYAEGLANFMKMPKLAGVIKWIMKDKRVPVLWNGPLEMPPGSPNLPIFVFSHGLGANRVIYSNIGYEIASHGFFVAAIEHRDRSASATFTLEEGEKSSVENASKYVKKWLEYIRAPSASNEEQELRTKQVHKRAEECSKLLNHLEELNTGTLMNLLSDFDLTPFVGKLNLEKCALGGHSFGGGTMVVGLSKDTRFKAGVALDVWMYPLDRSVYKTKIHQPILFINSDSFQWEANIAGIRKLDPDVTGVDAERKLVTLAGTVHHTQCDLPFLLSRFWMSRILRFEGKTSTKIANNINSKAMLRFLGKHLDLDVAGDVDSLAEEFPNLIYHGTNVKLDEEKVKKSKEKLKSEL